MPTSSSISHGKTTLDLRPESSAQRSRTSVVAKLMNRKMGPRRKQSIVPRVAKRRSKVYTVNGIGDNGIPASAAQFEKIRTLVENTVLRAPVRQEALTIQQLLNGLASCLTEAELVAICKECSKTLRTLDALGSLPSYVSLESVIINPSGTIKFKHLNTGISIDDLYLAPEYSNKFPSEKTCVFSLAATLWSAADWRLTEAEKPSLSPRFQELLVSMTEDASDARPGLYDVLQTCESLQTEGDMTSRERCQALLWEYQASAAIENDDTTKRKTAEEDKKHHDTLMGSISVAASFKGFLKQTAKPPERNPFVKAQNKQEPSNHIDGKSSGEISTKTTTPEPEEVNTKQNTVADDSQKLNMTSSKNVKSATSSDANNNQDPAIERKRGYSLTEDQKEQLLSLLASAKLNKNPFYTGEDDQKSDESRKPVEEKPVKPPSPSLYAYPPYGQTDAQMMFSPITPAGRSASPSVHSDVGDNQLPPVPNATYVPIAVPIPSVAPVPMPPFWYMPQGGMMPYPQQVMSPMPYVPNDASVTSNQSVVSTDSDVSEVSDMDLRPKRTSSPMPKVDKSESSKPGPEQCTRRSPALQNNKGSRLPRPIWQTPVVKGRTTPVESETNSSVVRRRVPFTGENNERREEIKPVRARTPSPSLGRRASSKDVTPPRSQTPPVYWTREGVDMPSNNKPRTRVSTGSYPNWRPASQSSPPDGRRRSSSSPSGSTPNSPVQRRRSQSRPSSPAGSRSNSPVSMLVSKFEQMSQESADNSPRVCSDSVSSMISKFGSSSLVPEDRIVKGQLKPNLSASAPQPGSKTGPLRPSSNRERAPAASDHAPSPSWPGNPTSSRDSSRRSESSDDNKRSLISNPADPRDIHRSGSDPGSTDNRQNRLSVESRNRLSTSHGNLDKENESTADKCYESRTRLLENIRKWTSQENITRDSSPLDARRKSVQERLASGLSLVDDYSTKTDKVDEKYSSKKKTERRPSGKISSTPSGRCSPGSDLRNDYVIKSNHASDNLSKPWKNKDGSSTDLARKSSLDSEPVREKGSPRSRPRDLCFTPVRDSSIQYGDVKSAKDFLWSPTSNVHKFEIPVDLAILESTTPSITSPLSSVGGFDLAYGGVDGNILSPTIPLSPGSLKDFKPSNYFTNVTFKCGEMEPERDTNCLPRRPSRESIEGVATDTVTNRTNANDNYVKRFERKILRSTGDIENDEPLSSSASGAVKSFTCRDSKDVESVTKDVFNFTGNPHSKNEAIGNACPVSSSSSAINSLPSRSSTQGSSATTLATEDSQSPRTRSRTDQILRSRHPSGDSPSQKGSTSASRNPPSPMTLRKLVSNPLDAKTSQTRTSTSKRNSLPTSQPINLLAHREPSNLPENRPLAKSSSQTNLSPGQKQVHKSSSHNNLSVRHTTAEGNSSNSLGKGSVSGQSNPHSKTVSTNNPHPKEGDIKTKSSKVNTNPGNPHPSKAKHGANERSRERNPSSSNPHAQASRTKSATPNASESSPVRYPYTRRGSTPVKGNSTIKPPPKAASNPTSPLYPKQPKGHMEFFGAAGATYPGNMRGSTNARDPISEKKELQEIRHNPKSRQRVQSSGESSVTSSGDGKSHLANTLENVLKSSLNYVDNPGDSDVFYIPSSQESVSKSGSTPGKTSKRFPSSSSSDSGLNLSDPDETRKSNGNDSKSNRLRSTPTSPNALSPSHSPSPTSPKFPIGTSIFYDPREKQNPLPSPEKWSSAVQNEPANMALLSKSVQPGDASNPFKTSSARSDESPNNAARNNSDRLKQVKGDVSKTTDKRSVDSSESSNSHAEKPLRDVPAVKAAALAHAGRLTSKEFVAPSTPPPDISGKLSSKSPAFSPRVDSKELLGQLVKKVLNSAAAKQGSSPKTSFAESATSATKEDGKGKGTQEKMFFLPDGMIEAQEKEKTNRQGKNPTTSSSNHKQRLSDTDEASKKKEQGLLDAKETAPLGNRDDITASVSPRSLPGASSETPISSSNASKVESSSPEALSSPEEKGVLSKIIDMIHDEFAFDGYMDDGVEDVNMAEYVLSLAGMSEENFKEAITDQYSDLYWDEDLLHDMYEAVTGGEKSRRPTLQFSESTVSDISPPESITLSREESYLSLEPLYFNSISRSSSERSGTGAKDILVSPLGEATEFLPIKVIAPEMQADIQGLLTPIFEDYHRVMGVKLTSSVEDLTEKLGTKIMEISQQLMLERRAKKKSMNSYNKMADVENKKDVKDLASKLVNEIEECDKKIIYLKNVQRQLRNVYAERFGLDTSLLYSFLASYNKTCVTLEPELNNNSLNFSPIWNQRVNESTDIVDESLTGPSLQSGTKLGLFSYLFDRHAMSQAYVRYFLYTFRYITTAQELFTFIREKCSASLRTDSSGQVYNHQLQIRYRALDLLSEWIDGYYQFDFKTNPSLIKELLAFVKDELILVDRSERGHYLMELIAEKQRRDLNNNSSSDEPSDFVAVLQLEDPQGLVPVDGKKDSPRKPLGSRKAKSPVQCFRRATPEKNTTYKPTLYLKALSVLDHSSRILAEQLTLIQQDLFFNIHPVHFLNSRAHGIGVGRSQSPTRERDNIFGFSTGSRRVSEQPGSGEGPLPWENNMYVSEPSTDGLLENLLEHAQDVSLWVAVEICSASSIKAQLALITKFVNAARYCCEIRNYSTCIQIIDALEMFVIRQLPVWKQVPTKTSEALEELKAVKVLLKTDSSWLMKSEASRDKPTIPCFLLFVIHVQQQELGGFTLPNDMYKWTKMRSAARLVDQIRLFKQMRYAFQTDDELKDRLKQRISECKKENLHALASENASNFHLSSSHGSRKFHDAFRKMKATFGGHN
ncbi:uncharacterized protein LOC144643172 isoform X1 [Oculina patagonica]